jgi:hypothetical protein
MQSGFMHAYLALHARCSTWLLDMYGSLFTYGNPALASFDCKRASWTSGMCSPYSFPTMLNMEHEHVHPALLADSCDHPSLSAERETETVGRLLRVIHGILQQGMSGRESVRSCTANCGYHAH